MGPVFPASHFPTYVGCWSDPVGRPDTRWCGSVPHLKQRGRYRSCSAIQGRFEEITLDIMNPIQGGFRWRRPRHTLKGRQDADAVDRSGLRLLLLNQQAEAVDITLLFADESEALTHPYLSLAWPKRRCDFLVDAPGLSRKPAMITALDSA